MGIRSEILDAVEAHVRAALPTAIVAQRRLFPVALANAGHVNIVNEGHTATPLAGSGLSGDPVRLLHSMRVGVHVRMKGTAAAIESLLDAASSAIETRIAADPTLGGLAHLIHFSDLTPEFAGSGETQAETASGLYRLIFTVAWRDQ
jgi:hypothetical protein